MQKVLSVERALLWHCSPTFGSQIKPQMMKICPGECVCEEQIQERRDSHVSVRTGQEVYINTLVIIRYRFCVTVHLEQ